MGEDMTHETRLFDPTAHEGRFFDRRGQPVSHELNDRLIGLTLEQIRQIGVRVVAAAGSDKHTALVAALAAGLATVLVTDAAMAQRLLRD